MGVLPASQGALCRGGLSSCTQQRMAWTKASSHRAFASSFPSAARSIPRCLKVRATLGPFAENDITGLLPKIASHPSVTAVREAVQPVYQISEDTVKEAASAAAASTSGGGGPFGFLADGFEAILKVLDSSLESAGIPYSYGFAIIVLTVLVKLLTFPLTKTSMESSMALQALQPQTKELQAKYANDQQTLQLETARLYKEAGVNPLAGCLPTLATIPVFIGLYRALTKAADDGLLTASFFWIPSLGGPTTLTARQAGAGLSWLFPFENGAPPIGWHDAVAYLALPVLLVISQYVSQKIIQPQNQDGSQKQAQLILNFLPLMIGWFSLNVPSGLSLYWFVNNILSTGQQLYLKSTIKAAGPASTAVVDLKAAASNVIPQEDMVKRLSGKEMGARKKKKEDGEDEIDTDEGAGEQTGRKLTRKERRGQKFRERKARESATKTTASQAASASNGDGSAAQLQPDTSNGTTAVKQDERLKVPDAPPTKD